MNREIPIFFTIDDSYAPFLAVALNSAIKNANIKLNYAALGPAIIYTNSDYSINEVSRAFKVGEKSVKREIDNIQSFQKPRSKKSRQFLDMIKN